MANQLDELNPEIREEGVDVNVIVKNINIRSQIISALFAVLLWCLYARSVLRKSRTRVRNTNCVMNAKQSIRNDAMQGISALRRLKKLRQPE